MAKLSLFERRRRRVRTALRNVSGGKPRLSVHRTGKHIYAQIIDDVVGRTLCAACSLDKEVELKGSNVATAEKVGALLATRAGDLKISEVVFARGGHLSHGKIKALADAARGGGLKF